MSAAQKRAYIIADKKLAENAKWDRKMLALEHEAIWLLGPGFDLTLSGFELEEIHILFDNEIATHQDRIPAVKEGDPVSKVGEMWRLGEHLLLCGDALEASSYERLMGNERAQMVLTDPPYNVRINGHVSSSEQHGEFVMASGEMGSAEFTSFLERAFANLIQFSCDGSMHYVFMDWGHTREILEAGSQYTEQKNLIVWDKGSAGMGSCYRSQHELVFLFKSGKRPHINNFKLGQNGRHRSNVWSYPGRMAGLAVARSSWRFIPPSSPFKCSPTRSRIVRRRTAPSSILSADQAPR